MRTHCYYPQLIRLSAKRPKIKHLFILAVRGRTFFLDCIPVGEVSYYFCTYESNSLDVFFFDRTAHIRPNLNMMLPQATGNRYQAVCDLSKQRLLD